LYNRNLARGNSGLRRLDPSLLESCTEGPVVTSRGLGPGPEGPSTVELVELSDLSLHGSVTIGDTSVGPLVDDSLLGILVHVVGDLACSVVLDVVQLPAVTLSFKSPDVVPVHGHPDVGVLRGVHELSPFSLVGVLVGDQRVDDNDRVRAVLADTFVSGLVVFLEERYAGLWLVHETETEKSLLATVALGVQLHGNGSLVLVGGVLVPVLYVVVRGSRVVISILTARGSVHVDQKTDAVFLRPFESLVDVSESAGEVVGGGDFKTGLGSSTDGVVDLPPSQGKSHGVQVVLCHQLEVVFGHEGGPVLLHDRSSGGTETLLQQSGTRAGVLVTTVLPQLRDHPTFLDEPRTEVSSSDLDTSGFDVLESLGKARGTVVVTAVVVVVSSIITSISGSCRRDDSGLSARDSGIVSTFRALDPTSVLVT